MLTAAGGVVIVGAGHAGFAAATALRDAGVDTPITLINGDCGLPYQRPPLSKAYLLGKVDRNRVAFRPEHYYTRREIDLVSGDAVFALDRAAMTVELASGATLSYQNLVLATGARPRPLPLPGHQLDGVLVLRSIADADLLRPRLAEAQRPVVVGGGFIGLEFAAVAAVAGTAATVLEAAPRLLARSVTETTASFLRGAHQEWGNSVRTDAAVQRFLGNKAGHVEGVELADCAVIPADLVVVGVGAVPATALAERAGLAVDDGVLVDRYLRTNDPHVFAVGDCARFTSADGTTLRLESVQNATDQARAVARTISGVESAYAATPWFWSDQHDLKLQIAGDLTGHEEIVVSGDPTSRAFSTYCFRGRSLVAVESVNRPTDHVAARKLLESRPALDPVDVHAGFDLAAYVKGS